MAILMDHPANVVGSDLDQTWLIGFRSTIQQTNQSNIGWTTENNVRTETQLIGDHLSDRLSVCCTIRSKIEYLDCQQCQLVRKSIHHKWARERQQCSLPIPPCNFPEEMRVSAPMITPPSYSTATMVACSGVTRTSQVGEYCLKIYDNMELNHWKSHHHMSSFSLVTRSGKKSWRRGGGYARSGPSLDTPLSSAVVRNDRKKEWLRSSLALGSFMSLIWWTLR